MVFWNSSILCNLDLDGANLGFPCILRRTHGRNGLKFGMLVYPDDLQSWLHFVPGWLMSLTFVWFWLGDLGKIWGFQAFSRECMKLGMQIYPDCLQSWVDFCLGVLIYLIVFMHASWLHGYLTGFGQLRGAAAIRSLNLLVLFIFVWHKPFLRLYNERNCYETGAVFYHQSLVFQNEEYN